MKRQILLIGIVCMLLIAGIASGAPDDKTQGLRPVTIGDYSGPSTPLPFGNEPGRMISDRVYTSLAPCYSEKMIRTYGPVPVYTREHQVLSRGILNGYTVTDRDMLYKKLDSLYESSKDSFNRDYSYPAGPVISYGYDALGSVSVGIYENWTVDPKTLDEMYSDIKEESQKQGIDNVPVVFYSEPVPVLDLGRSDVWRPIIGGVQTGTIGTLTTGFAATRGGQMGFVTTGHGGGVGTTVYQPDPGTPAIGTITVSSNGVSSDSAWVSYSNCAAQIFESSSSQPGVYGGSDPSVGMNIYMSGVSSGLRSGTVIEKKSAWNSQFQKMIDNQWFADYIATSGDSGAPVYFKDSGQNIQIAGIHWGRTTQSIFSPLSGIISDLS